MSPKITEDAIERTRAEANQGHQLLQRMNLCSAITHLENHIRSNRGLGQQIDQRLIHSPGRSKGVCRLIPGDGTLG